ncbi:MAG: hypothetical protein K0R43_1700 [Pseudoduganella sp.]|jgi:uncharacterized phiE125 gp8 family phage protein|nr:hypothetical protein [Pseudoduganella sp.]
MTTRLITPPATPALSLADAKDALKIDTSDQDAQVEAWVAGITAHAEHLTGRAFVTQTWRVTLDAFPDAIELAHPPISAVSSVKFIDTNGVLQTLDPQDYVLDKESEPGYVVPAPEKSWPSTASQINAVKVEYTCGYGVDTDIPESIRLYLIAKLREQYDPAIKADKGTVQSSFLDRLLDRETVFA